MKRGTWKIAIIVFVTLLATTIYSNRPAVAYDEKNPMVLKAAIDNPPGDMKAVTIKRMGDMIEKRTNGRVKFQYFYGASLIKKPQFVDAVWRQNLAWSLEGDLAVFSRELDPGMGELVD